MKKFKKLLAVLLIVAAVCALTAVPASAASASGNGNGDGFNWSSSLTLNSTSATARMVVSKKPSGAAPAYFCAEVKGYVYSYNGGRSMISNSSGFVTICQIFDIPTQIDKAEKNLNTLKIIFIKS